MDHNSKANRERILEVMQKTGKPHLSLWGMPGYGSEWMHDCLNYQGRTYMDCERWCNEQDDRERRDGRHLTWKPQRRLLT